MSGLLILIIVVVAVAVLSSATFVGVGMRRRRRAADEATPCAPVTPASSATLVAPPRPSPASPGAGAADPPAADVAGDAGVEATGAEATGVDAEAVAEAEAVVAAAEAVLAERPRLRDRLGRARGVFGDYLGSLRSRGKVDDTTWDELEEALILADAGLPTTTRILDGLRARARAGELPDAEAVVAALKDDLVALFDGEDRALRLAGESEHPDVWLFVGVNGVGKTTTIGKVAAREAAVGRKVVLAAGDTFRAAAGEQLETWAERAGGRLVRGADGADPSSVIFDAVQHAAARGADLVLADTAGRLHTKVNLMDELR